MSILFVTVTSTLFFLVSIDRRNTVQTSALAGTCLGSIVVSCRRSRPLPNPRLLSRREGRSDPVTRVSHLLYMNNNDHNNTAQGLCGPSLDLTLHAIHAHPDPVAGPRRASRACKNAFPPLARTFGHAT